MFKKFALASVFVLGTAVPALADPNDCSEPLAPAAVDGATATKQQMIGAHDDVMNFMKASDDFQVCMGNDLRAQKLKAEHDKKPLDPSVQTATDAKISANQAMKERVGAEFNTAVAAYKAKNP